MQLEMEKAKKENVETILSWLLKRGIVRIVDKLIESFEFTLGIKRMKAACIGDGQGVVNMQSGNRLL